MFVKSYTIDNVIQNKVTFETKELEDAAQVEGLIKSLDGSNRTTITFDKDELFNLTICGTENNFVLYVMITDYYCFTPNKEVDYNNLFVTINNSGDSNTYPTKLVLDLETSIKVVKTYVETGRLDDCIKWIQY